MSRFASAMLAPISSAYAAVHGHRLLENGEADALLIEFSEEDLRDGLRRGTPVHEIVAGAGKHWNPNSLLSEQSRSWTHSKPVRRNAAFISHSWKSSRFLKWLALLAFFNGRSAAVASLIAAVAAVWLDFHARVGGLLIYVWRMADGQELQLTFTMLPLHAGTAVGAFVFFAGHHIRGVFEAARLLPPQSVFLDKLAIHQDDEDLRDRGIRLLGAFINDSDTFLVLWSHEYLTRLWCAYEVAVFAHLKLSINFPGRLCVWPLPLIKVVAAKATKDIFIHSVLYWGPKFLGLSSTCMIAFAVVWFVATFVTTKAMLELWRHLDAMRQQFDTFDLRATDCVNPSDRASVESAITCWFEHTSTEEAIEKYNAFVRKSLHACISQSFRDRAPIMFATALWAALPNFLFALGFTNNFHVGALNYSMIWIMIMAPSLTLALVIWAWQFRMIRIIEQCGDTKQDEVASNSHGLSRRPVVVHVVLCWVVDIFMCSLMTWSEGLTGEKAPPVPVALSVSAGVALFAIYSYI